MNSNKKRPPVIKENTPEEDAKILAAAANDPDALPRTDEQLSKMKRGRGRPQGITKTQVGIGLDHDVATYYRNLGKGHQAIMNDVLRKGMEGDLRTLDKRDAVFNKS